MRRLAAAVMVAALAGCDSGAKPTAARPVPKISRLATGADAVVYGEDATRPVWFDAPGGGSFPRGSPAYVLPATAVGTRVTVVDDKGNEADPQRKVVVNIKDGEMAGIVAEFGRDSLRPAPPRP